MCSNISVTDKNGRKKNGQFSDISTWEQSSPGQCFGPLIQILSPEELWKAFFSPTSDRSTMLSKDVPDIEVNDCVYIFLFLFYLFSQQDLQFPVFIKIPCTVSTSGK